MTILQSDAQTSSPFIHFIDGISVIGAVGALVGYLPAIAALFTIIWTGIRIYETKTVQNLIHGKADK